jgi:hypothetical protein
MGWFAVAGVAVLRRALGACPYLVTGLGLSAIIVMPLLFGGPHAIQAAMRELLAPMLDRLFDEATPGRSELARLLAMIMPGIIVVFWMVMTLTQRRSGPSLARTFRSRRVAAISRPRCV